MSYETKFPDWKERIVEASKEESATKAAASLGIKFDTYRGKNKGI